MLGLSPSGTVVCMRQHSIPWDQAGPHAHQQTQTADTRTPTTVDLVVPVYNEETALAASVETLLRATSEGDSHVTIIIADNASTDSTPSIAEALVEDHPKVRCVRLEQQGRGRALATVCSESNADVVVYTDVDLATDIRALDPMVEFKSRCCNRLLRVSLGVRFSDAQCGFKAMSATAAKMLLPSVEDKEWFFDTELGTRAEWAGLRIHEFGGNAADG